MRKIIGKGRGTLYRGDCLDRLRNMRDNSVDIVVTSPPYNQLGSIMKGKPSGMMKNDGWIKKVKAIGYNDSWPEPLYQKWIAYVVAKGLVWINHKIRYRNRAAVHPLSFLTFPVYAEVVWDRRSSIALNCQRYAPSHEYLYAFGKPHYWDRSLDGDMSVWRIRHATGIQHPCPYPDELPRRPILSSCPPDGVVLDPFVGSGTTGKVALELGRRFIGIEKHKRFLNLAATRIREGLTA